MRKKSKVLGLLLCTALFGVFALGSGSSGESTRDSVSIESDSNKVSESETGATETESKESTEVTQSETTNNSSDKVEYEISDTSFEYYTNSIGSVEYYGYVEILNTGNCDIYLDNCTFDIEDNDGHLLQSDSYVSHCPEVISPGEKGYFYNGLGSNLIDSGVSFDNGVKLVPQMKLTKATGKPASYPVSDVSVREGDFGDIKITGRVENNTEQDIGYIYINILFYNSEGKLLAITGTSLTDIGAGNKGSFDTSTAFANENLKLRDIADTVVIAEAMYMQW